MYDKARADRAVRFIRLLRHTRGKWAGVPFNLRPWQEKPLREIFGTVGQDGLRQYRWVYWSTGKKNGKSEIASAIALFMLFADGEIGAEIYSAAADKEQAAIVFNTAVQMVGQSRGLSKRCKIIESAKRIIVPSTGSVWRVLSADAFTKHGLNPSAVIFDELHAQPNRDLWDTLTQGFGTREQPLLIALTTAGYDRNSICYEQYNYAKQVQIGVIEDPTFYSVIYELPEESDWQDSRVWKLANPALGDFLSLDEFRAMARKAGNTPALLNNFLRLRLNRWTQQVTKWIPVEKWDASAGEVNVEELAGRECYGGLDLASTTDVTAFVLLFPLEDGSIRIVPHFWIPEENMHERVNRDRVPYDVWVREGLITATPGNVVDYGAIEERIKSLAEEYDVREIAFDRWNALKIVQNLEAEGLTTAAMGQGFASLSAPMKEFETRVLQKRLHHGGNPVLRWMMDNVAVRQDAAGNIKPDKEKSKEKIDGIVATIMALDRIVRHESGGASVYEERGIITI